ncbi:hypothetical protein SPYJRS4_1412 [Streptococcus pyogenes JRS4]|uniref:Uncharacterized protein n=1 Tax=Streptococcus pyogenes serotype M12 (strain MGAS9429) TaxID=370551 RepID=Q1JKJ2_STRPC|nr:Hypothetical protein M6_Spy1439 [Streptococcus pyogenes MGAS10394]ABF32577.1 hypothetical protein MGAS9429_Spy1391 [Streptococcus pyogenes MGAS9429]ABF34575.1 hypothetical protein MGAS10270_Spy1511 [Streptococcus pyogenes MGAS10270]ABF36466.1 hypothetical protein MGAS2096_Spy1415 [Streptococcus pyogenes MGAS2096]ABF38452.1 hypothetical protein MGAS10750_Spy1503 [Streptococcus pyogenes MGAS10750]EFM33915.1 hypothetical protein HMPREF0841_0487 [Streptococcus pyogenes ATCC 10782]SDV84727.1 hy
MILFHRSHIIPLIKRNEKICAKTNDVKYRKSLTPYQTNNMQMLTSVYTETLKKTL